MNNDRDLANLIGIISDNEVNLIGLIQEDTPSLIGYITPSIAYLVPVPEVPTYDGPYMFIPSENTQIINVGGHIVPEDITISDVPFAEVTNPIGGYTVTIGE